MQPLSAYRQSLLQSFETCPRKTWFSLAAGNDFSGGYVGAAADLGRLVHAVYAEILRTMRRQGEEQVSTQECVEIMREVDAASDIVLPSDEREDLVWLTLRFAEFRLDPSRIMYIEEPLEAYVVGQDGKARRLTGTPDVLIADAPDGIIIEDWKTGRAVPKSPRKPPPEGEPIVGKKYLSARGHFQLDTYSLLSLRTFPRANRVAFRERHLRSGEVREAFLYREELEHVERELGCQMQKFERGLEEGEGSELWRPRSGHHCLAQCPVTASCPIPQEQRGIGALHSTEDADTEGARFVVVDALRQQMRERLKAFHDETGHAPQAGIGTVLRWKETPSGGRSFGVWEPEGETGV